MTMPLRTDFAVLLASLAVSLALPGAVRAVCPDIPCDCVGEAARYTAVALDDLFSNGSTVYGHLCAETARLVDPTDDANPDDIVGDLHVLAGPGQVGVRASIPRTGPGDSVVVAGVLATGGGSVVGPVTAGTLDTTGTHPGIGSCQQAAADIQAASQTLAGLAPTQVVDRIIADSPGTTQFDVGPGINVIQVDGRIAVRDGVLVIALDPATDVAVFNARALSLKRFTRIVVSGGDDTKVMINLPGSGPAVVVKLDAWVAPVVFAPERVARVTGARFAGIFGRRVQLRKAFVDQIFDTCASPSGAFLEAPEAL